MTVETQLWVQLGAQALEALVWLVLTAWCLERLRTHLWARLAGVGAVLLLIPATTLSAGRAQLMWGDSSMILQNYSQGSLPTVYAVMKLVAAALLLTAVLVGRRPATSPGLTLPA